MFGGAMVYANKDHLIMAMLNGLWIGSHNQLILGSKIIKGIVTD